MKTKKKQTAFEYEITRGNETDLTDKEYFKLVKQFITMFEVDHARIVETDKTYFLIIGIKKHSHNEWVQLTQKKKPKKLSFDYLEQHVIANGKNIKELFASAKEYKRLCGMTMKTYLEELTGKKIFDVKVPHLNKIQEFNKLKENYI